MSEYHNMELADVEIKALEELEELVGVKKTFLGISISSKKIPPLIRMKWDAFGYYIEAGKLVGLGLSKRELTSVPESIRKLTNLKELSLWNNQLKDLPEWLGELTNLERLFLGDNQLIILPEWIGQLTNLIELSLWNNKLKTLPESIGQLVKLKEIHLRGNKIQSLPDSAKKLEDQGCSLYLPYWQT